LTHTGDLINQQKGFTLVEMAIVLMIVGLLLGGMLVPLSAQMEQRNISETRKTLDEIQQALIGFAIVNGRLPCPADGTTPTGGTNAALVPAGQEYKIGATCANAEGVLPWATLGVSETDAWGRRYTYHVATAPTPPLYPWSDSLDGTGAGGCNITVGVSFQLCSSANLDIRTAALPGGTSLTSGGVPVVVVSHGKNGYGAYTPSGGSPLAPSPDADEADNSDGDVHFVSKTTTRTFDDLVVWISPNILFNRMVAAGKLP
jgi:prepilin-type N-terminal cleavage/methylation domain-containing protein